MLAESEQFAGASWLAEMTLKAIPTRLLSTSLSGFRNVPTIGLSVSSFPCGPFFITETEMLAFRCSEKRAGPDQNPGQIQVNKKIG